MAEAWLESITSGMEPEDRRRLVGPGAAADDRDGRFLSSLKTAIDEGMTGGYLESEPAYLTFLGGLVEMVADEARLRNGLR